MGRRERKRGICLKLKKKTVGYRSEVFRAIAIRRTKGKSGEKGKRKKGNGRE